MLCETYHPQEAIRAWKANIRKRRWEKETESITASQGMSLYWMMLGMLHAFTAQLAPMIWSITAFLFQKLVCIPSCLLSGARKFLTAVLWHVILPESKTLLWIRQNSNPQLVPPGIGVPGTFVRCAALCPARWLWVAERNPGHPEHWQEPLDHSVGLSAW